MGQTGIPQRGFLADLFDVRFQRFVTTRLVTVLYVIGIVVLALAVIAQIAVAFRDPAFGVFMLLIVGPLVFFLGVLYMRVLLEVLVVLFRIGDDTSRMRALLESRDAAPPGPPPEG